MAGRRKNLLHQAKFDKPRIENPSKGTSTGRTIYGGVESLVNEKKIAFSREKTIVPPKIDKPYDSRNFYAGIDIIDKHGSEKFVASRSNEVLVLRQEIKDWKSHEDRANAVEDKLSRIESGMISASDSINKLGDTKETTMANTGKNGHRPSPRAESQPEAPAMIHNNEKLRSSCSTSRSAADRQTTGPNKREGASHVRTRSLDRSSPRVGRADNRGSSVNHTVQTDMKNLQDYLPRKLKKKSQTPVPESPLYSPETLNALENAEKLIKEAQKRILEASYDVNSSPERDSSARSGETKTKDEESLYIRDVVATRFHEANESGRIFTRITARRPIEKPYKSPELRQRWHGQIVEETSKIYGKDRAPRRVMPIHKKSLNPADENEKLRDTRNLDKKKTNDANSPQVPTGREISMAEILEKRINCNKRDETVCKSFKVQEGPRVDIRNELTITSVEKIDISPRPPSFPVQHNIKTYEFRHGEPRVAERDNEPGINAESRDKPEEKSCVISNKNPAAVSSTERGSSSDLVENKSGRSIESEALEGLENARTSCRDEKPNNARQSFMDFLQRPENRQNVITNDPLGDSSEQDAKNQFEIFDRAVQQFFNNFKRSNRARHDREFELESPDGEFLKQQEKFDESDVSEKSDVDVEFSGDGKFSGDDWDLRTPDFGGLDYVLKKFDGSMSRVLRGARDLELLISEYSIDENISSRSKSNSLIGDSGAIGGHRFYPVKDIDEENERIHEKPTKDLSKNENFNISEFTGKDQASESSRDFSQAFTRLSQCENPRKESPLKRFLGKKIFSHPRYSTPLNNDFKIGKSFDNPENRNVNDFANFFNGIHRSKTKPDKKLSQSQEISRIEKINDDKTVTATPIALGAAENHLEAKKKMILNEIEKKCNFQTLFTRDRSTRDENLETHENAPLATCSSHENPRTPPSSLIQKSTTDPDIVTHDKNPIVTKKVDEFLPAQNSERSAAGKSAESPQNQSSLVKKTGSARSDTLSGIQTSVRLETAEKSKKHEDVSLVSKSENIVRSPPKNESDMDEKTKNISADEEEAKDRNPAISSSGSSVRDRTSFDISTAYSEDFEEPSESSRMLNNQEKPNSLPDLPVESAPSEPEVSTKAETNSNRVEDTKKSTHASLADVTTSKNEIASPEKSIFSYLKELGDINEHGDFNDAETNLEPRSIREKLASENSVEPKEEKMAEIEENPKKASDSSSCSVKSSKISRTSSLDEESGHDGKKAIVTGEENYSEGELYLPSSCSYSLGEIRISELGTCTTASGFGVESSRINADTMRIFVSRSLINTDSTDNAINSLGEVQETEIELTSSN